ncbi:hypothetical protein M0812_22854 [Anaeramoeba flamelloides]|uniref:Uncharacterized protein n=1 Tax=Anaeramoeba flamelloides TaxID=1746091 RepID=A0AAV7YMZ0_9EUKA|nr:hypothetical protein M0812_22854 [Anaeramoeba flamelloides]
MTSEIEESESEFELDLTQISIPFQADQISLPIINRRSHAPRNNNIQRENFTINKRSIAINLFSSKDQILKNRDSGKENRPPKQSIESDRMWKEKFLFQKYSSSHQKEVKSKNMKGLTKNNFLSKVRSNSHTEEENFQIYSENQKNEENLRETLNKTKQSQSLKNQKKKTTDHQEEKIINLLRATATLWPGNKHKILHLLEETNYLPHKTEDMNFLQIVTKFQTIQNLFSNKQITKFFQKKYTKNTVAIKKQFIDKNNQKINGKHRNIKLKKKEKIQRKQKKKEEKRFQIRIIIIIKVLNERSNQKKQNMLIKGVGIKNQKDTQAKEKETNQSITDRTRKRKLVSPNTNLNLQEITVSTKKTKNNHHKYLKLNKKNNSSSENNNSGSYFDDFSSFSESSAIESNESSKSETVPFSKSLEISKSKQTQQSEESEEPIEKENTMDPSEKNLQSVSLLRHKLSTKFKAQKKSQIKAQNSNSSKNKL